MDDLISIELTYDEWNQVLYGLHCACYLEYEDTRKKEYGDIHESIYNQMKIGIYDIVKKESH